MVRKMILSLCCLAGMACSGTLLAQTRLDVADFKEECDSLTALLEKRTQVRSVVRIKQLSANGMLLNFSFTERTCVRFSSKAVRESHSSLKSAASSLVWARRVPLQAIPARQQRERSSFLTIFRRRI